MQTVGLLKLLLSSFDTYSALSVVTCIVFQAAEVFVVSSEYLERARSLFADWKKKHFETAFSASNISSRIFSM